MPGLLTLLLIALAASALTAIVSGVVALRRAGRLRMRHGLASGGLALVAGFAAVAGLAALQPIAPRAPAVQPAPAVAVVDAPDAVVEVQLATLALEE
ncbi:MAG: hypothetical protein QM598_09175 [Protaetiibacter sp.]